MKSFEEFMGESESTKMVKGRQYFSAAMVLGKARELATAEGAVKKKGRLIVTTNHIEAAKAHLNKEHKVDERVIADTRATEMVDVGGGMMKPRKKIVKVVKEDTLNESPDNAWKNRMDRAGATHYQQDKGDDGSTGQMIHAYKKADGEKKYLGSFDRVKQKEVHMKMESETLDEISSDTLKSYHSKAASKMKSLDKASDLAWKAGDKTTAWSKADKADAIQKNMAKARDKVAKKYQPTPVTDTRTGEQKYGPAADYGKGKYMGDSTMLSFSEFKQIHEAVEAEIDQKLTGLKENSPFDLKNYKSQIDWSDKKKSTDTGTVHKGTYGSETHRAPNEVGKPVEKKSVGRPAGDYGTYKVDKAARDTKEYKDALSAKVRASKADGFAARSEYKTLMNDAIKKRQAELHNNK